jgi:hypothetical protein
MNTNLIILFIILIVLSVVVIGKSRDKQLTSIHSREGFYVDDKNQRMADILYSGDIIDIADTNDDKAKFFNRHDYNSQIIMNIPEEKGVTTNLSKLRIISVNHTDKSVQVPIKYGDTVVLSHNAYIENQNSVRYIKYGDTLQSHQEGETFRTFTIVNPANVSDTSFIKYDVPILLKRSDSSDNGYMGVQKDSTIGSKNTMNTANPFYLKMRRVYEAYEKNLCICVGEILYP